MYIELTTSCNMSCGHCIFGCSKHKKGTDMPWGIFKKAIKACEVQRGRACFGGGEPTLHPDFWKYLGHALEADIPYFWMATNGSKTRRILALLDLAASKTSRIVLCLSRDKWHDPIDASVVYRFEKEGWEIRDNEGKISHNGSAEENGIWDTHDCHCAGTHVKVSGAMYPCGCDDAPLLGYVQDNPDAKILHAISELGLGKGCHIHWTEEDIASVTFHTIQEKSHG